MEFLKRCADILPEITAEAHCDIPCGIYDPTPAKIAAKTVARMVSQMQELGDPHDAEHIAALNRRIAVKEEHAEACKRELSILWSDFFKPEHLKKFPALHDTVWKALKLCSRNKQETNAEAASELVAAVDEIAKMFYEAKNVPERFNAYREITDKLY